MNKTMIVDRVKSVKKWMPVMEKINAEGFVAGQLEEFCYMAEAFALLEAATPMYTPPSYGMNGSGDKFPTNLPLIIKALFKAKSKMPKVAMLFAEDMYENYERVGMNLGAIADKDSESVINSIADAIVGVVGDAMVLNINIITMQSVMSAYGTTAPRETYTFTMRYKCSGASFNSGAKSEVTSGPAAEAPSAPTANFQQCAGLEIEDLYDKSTDGLADIMNLQKDIQETVYGYNWRKLQTGPLSDLKKFIDWNEEALRDESREFAAALTGIHTYPNCWKPWKAKHGEALSRSLTDLTPDELLELKFEWIDQLHFFLNIGLAIGMTPRETYNMYFSKNKENRARQQKAGGY